METIDPRIAAIKKAIINSGFQCMDVEAQQLAEIAVEAADQAPADVQSVDELAETIFQKYVKAPMQLQCRSE